MLCLTRVPHASGGFSALLAQGEHRHAVLHSEAPTSAHLTAVKASSQYLSALARPL